LGLPLCASIPFGYSILSAAVLLSFFRTKNYGFFRFSELTLILILPFLLQWGLGGFAASSAVMIWSILSPIGALMFAGTRQALPWFLAYLLLMAISGIFDIRLVEHAKTLPRMAVAGFFFMNIAAVSSIAFLLLKYFVHKRELAMKALGEEHKRVSQERERLAKIKSVLAYFVPETAKSIIEKDPDKALLEKYIQDATVLFLDIEAFTTLVQEYPHDRINRAIESYFSTFFDLIQKRGGDINETAGDGMMVIFLNPDPIMHAKNAVKTALEIQRKCEQYTEIGNPDLFPIRVNIGISSGEVYLGSTKMRGTEGDRWTFTASGPVTILAARLSEYGNGGQVLVGEETARRIGESFSLASLGEVNLKNIEDSGEIFQVLAAQKNDDVQNP
jgi:class 3 adenylate cyclase